MKGYNLNKKLFKENTKEKTYDELVNHLKLHMHLNEDVKECKEKGYFITTEGRVFGIKRNNITELSPSNNNGYKQVIFLDNGYRKTKVVHRLVAEAFIPNPNNYPQVNHKDEDRANNNVNNLEWMSPKDNTTYSQGRKVKQIDPKTKQILRIFDSTHDAEKFVGACKGEVSNCCRHRRNQVKVKGYIFEYV